MKLQRRHVALVLCAGLGLAAACQDPSVTTDISTSLLPADSENRGAARVWRPLRQRYEAIDGSEDGVSVVEGVGILDDLTVEGGTVDLVLTHQDANIDSIEVTGMQIEGNAFSGGVVAMIDGGVDVTAVRTGGVNGVDAAGLFFGPVVDGAPMEVGGEITIQGFTGSDQIFFIAE